VFYGIGHDKIGPYTTVGKKLGPRAYHHDPGGT